MVELRHCKFSFIFNSHSFFFVSYSQGFPFLLCSLCVVSVSVRSPMFHQFLSLCLLWSVRFVSESPSQCLGFLFYFNSLSSLHNGLGAELMQTTSETNDPVLYLAWSMHGSAEAPAGCLSSMKEKRKRFMIFYRSLTRNTRNHNCNICDQSKHFIYLFIWLMACCAVSLWNIEVKWYAWP